MFDIVNSLIQGCNTTNYLTLSHLRPAVKSRILFRPGPQTFWQTFSALLNNLRDNSSHGKSADCLIETC